MLLFLSLGLWNFTVCSRDSENRLVAEAGHVAAQIAGLAAMPGVELDDMTANALVAAAMEDERVYAVKVETNDGLMEGQRRNYLWEPIPWDNEITENCVQGMNPINSGGSARGKVEVWLSPRLNAEDEALLARRELTRLGLSCALWTLAFVFFIWMTGDFRRLKKLLNQRQREAEENRQAENIIMDMQGAEQKNEETVQVEQLPAVDAALGRSHQRKDSGAWFVTAGMFRQTFARAPVLISRLFAAGETAGLCHLGRILEQAAPCIGAVRLQKAAREMQKALNNPDCESRAAPVEECVKALEEVLDALCGNGQWRSRPECERS